MLQFAFLLAIDYGVAFLPPAGDRQVVIVYNAGDSSGTHAYKLVMRAFAPDGSLACETSATVAAWNGRMTMKRIAWFETTYANGSTKVRSGKYLLRAYLTEQIASGNRRRTRTSPTTSIRSNRRATHRSNSLSGREPIRFDARRRRALRILKFIAEASRDSHAGCAARS